MKAFPLSICIKALLAAGFVILCIVYAFMFFAIAASGSAFPEFNYLVLPCEIALCISAVPCLVSLWLFWGISSTVAQGQYYCAGNAKSLKTVGLLAASDTALCLIALVCLGALGAVNGGLIVFSLLIILAGAAFTALILALSMAVNKAAASPVH
jgi:hypothetical protein